MVPSAKYQQIRLQKKCPSLLLSANCIFVDAFHNIKLMKCLCNTQKKMIKGKILSSVLTFSTCHAFFQKLASYSDTTVHSQQMLYIIFFFQTNGILLSTSILFQYFFIGMVRLITRCTNLFSLLLSNLLSNLILKHSKQFSLISCRFTIIEEVGHKTDTNTNK